MAVRTVLKQSEKNSWRDPCEKRWTCYYYGKKGHLKQDCPHASKPPPAPCLVCKGPHWRRVCTQRHRTQGLDSQDNQDWSCLGVPTQAPSIIKPGEPQVLITVGGQSIDFLLELGKLTLCLLKPRPSFSPIRFHNGTVWMRQMLLFQPSSKQQLGPCAIFKRVSDRAKVSLAHFGEGYTEQGPCLCFHEYWTLPFSPFSWTKRK